MKKIIIRRGKKEDIERLWDLEIEMRKFESKISKFRRIEEFGVGENSKKKWIKDFKLRFKKKNIFLLVVESRGSIIAYLVGGLDKWKFSDDAPFKIAKVGDLIVSEKYRRKGIANLLMNEFEKWASSKKVYALVLHVLPKNEKSYNLYKKLNYEDYIITLVKKLK